MGVPEIKEDHAWCPHCLKSKGCGIYADRPQRCRDFSCQWLKDEHFEDHWFPKTARIVVDHRVGDDGVWVCFVVDPNSPLRWKEEPWFSDIKRIAGLGLAGWSGVKWTTVVLVRDVRHIIGH
jgi:hypothetical protein